MAASNTKLGVIVLVLSIVAYLLTIYYYGKQLAKKEGETKELTETERKLLAELAKTQQPQQ